LSSQPLELNNYKKKATMTRSQVHHHRGHGSYNIIKQKNNNDEELGSLLTWPWELQNWKTKNNDGEK
jgi:hypothetical protein